MDQSLDICVNDTVKDFLFSQMIIGQKLLHSPKYLTIMNFKWISFMLSEAVFKCTLQEM